MKKSPLVSVNIRTHNSEITIGDTLESLKKQTYKHIEILISDGYSKDRSVQIAKSHGARVRFADKLGDARQQNYNYSRGKYILSLDSDQVLDPKLIETCVKRAEKGGLDALTISERSKISKGTLIEKLIAYDKWVIDQNQDADVVFGTACPRFFRKEILKDVAWPKHLAVFDDTILYEELLRKNARIAYLANPAIYHYEVSSLWVFAKKFFRYGKGYLGALRQRPATIAAHSLPRRSYFSLAALSRPDYFLGLLVLYTVKALAAAAGVVASLVNLRDWLVAIGDASYYLVLNRWLGDAESILDVGCGASSPLGKIKKHFYSVGVDVYKPSVETSKAASLHDDYKVVNVLSIDRLFGKKKFDAVIALDIIEHLEKKEGLSLLKKMEALAKKKVIVMTPQGFVPQAATDGNTFQVHKSGWTIEDFRSRGYRVRGIRGLKWLRGEYATLKWKPWFFWGLVSALSEPFVYFFPRLAYQLLAVKTL